MFTGKTLLISGGTGSFGNAVLNRFLDTDIKEIRVFSRDEKKQEDMRISLANLKVKFYIGNVRDYESLLPAMEGVIMCSRLRLETGSSCEFYPLGGSKNQCAGHRECLKCRGGKRCGKGYLFEHRQAVYPINAMGISKALMEKLMVAKSRFTNPVKTTMC